MISRSLGVEAGGAVGIPLFLAQALSVSLYTIGFADSLSISFPDLNNKAIGMGVTLLIGLLALFSTRAAIRMQYIIMGAIALSLLSLLFGKPMENTTVEMWGVPAHRSAGFWTVFAVFFPAVTGIMAGVNMSGDLKNPAKSIPKGTFMAVGTGYLIYMVLPIILASRADATTLIADPLIMTQISFWGDAILLGVWGATLSSAVGSMMGAPRVLQALTNDQVLPRKFRWLGKGTGLEKIPRAGTFVTMGIALVAVFFGNLDVIAPILTMFFLTTYGVLNITAGVERFLKSPSFRPSFRVHWSFSLLGAVGCMAVMFLINPLATIIAIFFVALIYIWLTRRGLKSAWGDVRRGLWLAITRSALLRLDSTPHPKSWRPHILILSGAPTRRWHLIELGKALTHGQALMTVSTILKTDTVSLDRVQAIENNIREYLQGRRVPALVRVIAASDPFTGGMHLVDTYGLGTLVPNTVLLGNTQEAAHRARYCQMIRYFFQHQRNVIIVRDDEVRGFGERKRIDVWWGGLKGNGGLMIILAYLLQSSVEWRNATVYIKMVVSTEMAAQGARENLITILNNMRVDFRQKVIVAKKKPFWEIIREESENSDLVMLGMAEPGKDFANYYEQLNTRTQKLPSTIFVLAAQEIAFQEVLH